MSNIIKVLHIPTGGLISDGILSCITDYMSEMDKTNFDIRVLATNDAEKQDIQKVENSGCTVVFNAYRKKNIIKYFFLLYRYLKREKIDIIHVHGSSAIMFVELFAAKLSNCKVRIAHCHNTTCSHQLADKLLRPFFYWTYTEAFACGKNAGKWMYKERNFLVIQNGRNIKKYEYNSLNRSLIRNKLNIDKNALVIGHVGRFNDQKNHEYLIQIFEEYYKKNSNSFLVLVGTGENLEKIKNKVKQSPIKNNVIFTGILENVNDYLSAFDVMLLPSLYEGLPMVTIEWQIAGLPCIVSNKVTDECAITTLIKFESIEVEPKKWAIDIENISLQDREKNKDVIFRSIRESGYDIEIGAKQLKNIYINLKNQ